MKKVYAVLAGFVFLLSNLSCTKTKDKINDLTEFTIDYSTEVPVPSTSVSLTAPAVFTSPDIPTGSATRFAAEKTTKELIDEIKMTRFNLSVASGNLDFLKSISIAIVSDGVADVVVATKSNIPAGSTSVAADLSGANIKEFIFKDKFKLKVTVSINTALTADQKLKIDQTVTVKGKKIS